MVSRNQLCQSKRLKGEEGKETVDLYISQKRAIFIIEDTKVLLRLLDGEFVKYEDNIVYIKMMGACSNCHLIDFTVKDVIEDAIKEEVPQVKQVININNMD